MKILVIGGGGREHALVWKLAESSRTQRIFVAPGNAGTAMEPKTENIPIDADDIPKLLEFAIDHKVDLTVVGPEVPLVAGIVDEFEAVGMACFGPKRLAARMEGSKSFSKGFLSRHNIPSAEYRVFTDPVEACRYIDDVGAPIVVKADGLAAGKGVVIAQTVKEANDAVRSMLSDNIFGEAGTQVVIEEFLTGEEASFIVIADGKHALPLATSQDHKARDNGDLGPNTGGMGAYSPAPVVTPEIHRQVMRDIIRPTLGGMASEGMPYTGFLYVGLMINADGQAKVLEYNCRLGDPETQPIMMRLNSDLVELCQAALDQRLDAVELDWDARVALGVVMAAGGYPGSYRKGIMIRGLPNQASDSHKLFHAGTRCREGGQIETNGGRVFCACALADSIKGAQEAVYRLVESVHWDDAYYRTDIGYKALKS